MRSRAVPPNLAFLEFIKAQVPHVTAPATLSGWDNRLERVAGGLKESMGRMPEVDAPLDPEILGIIQRDGYVIERLTFQSRPGVRVTANLYRPDPIRERKLPGVLHVHGHWAWARMDEHVQQRCLGLVKLGYVCLAVDAFGAGERAIEPASGTYHGAFTGASLWPCGLTLLGLQVYDNRRAVDYLASRPEVDARSLGITGASGGGNQSLYSGATDTRLKAVVPVCGIGSLESYLGAACCVCEVLPGALRYTTTGDLLAMMAPRGLLIISASKDAPQFSAGEAKKSMTYAHERYRLLGVAEKIRQTVIDSGHDYNQPMREAMYGWMNRWLKDEGDGTPVPEPQYQTEDVATLRCYPDGASRPKTIVTIPEFVRSEARARLQELPPSPDHVQRWEADSRYRRSLLQDQILGGFPKRVPLDVTGFASSNAFAVPKGSEPIEVTTETGLRLRGLLSEPDPKVKPKGVQILLMPSGLAGLGDELGQILSKGHRVLVAELRATGFGKPETSPIHKVVDHTEAEWSLWIGRPLLGQWVWDVMRWLDTLEERGRAGPYTVRGYGPFGAVALITAALDSRLASVQTVQAPTSFQDYGATSGMGGLAPGILRVGDIPQLAALVAPRPLEILEAVESEGTPVTETKLKSIFAPTQAIYDLLGVGDRLRLGPGHS